MERVARINDHISKHAGMFPAHVAVRDVTGALLTYGELNARANQFARFLQAKYGIKPGDRVALALSEKSVDVMVALLGILKADAAYVLLNNELPKASIDTILQESAAKCLITDNDHDVLSLKNIDRHIAPYADHDVTASSTNDIPAYVLYTSGTTGQPKGVEISHNNLLAVYTSWASEYALTPDDRHLQMASMSFDVFTGDWMRALCSGAELILFPTKSLTDAASLYATIEHEKITVAEFVPAVLNNLRDYVAKKSLRLNTFRTILCGSDLWAIGDYRRLQPHCPKTKIINTYGLTEAGIDSTFFPLTPESTLPFRNTDIVPIGTPFPHARVYLLDEHKKEVATNKVGELHIGGPGIATGGYLNRDALSREKFLEIEPFGRLYATGDQAKRLDDGTLLFLGRNELQVKIAGKRVEIISTEAALQEHPRITKAIVIPVTTGSTTRLHAYLQTDSDAVHHQDLLKFLAQRLPPYCIPHRFFQVDSIPLTPNGKINRKSQYQTILAEIKPAKAEPLAGIEVDLAILWKKMLSYDDDINNTDNFMRLGGNSLTYAAMLAEANKLFGANLSPVNNHVTIHDIANEIYRQRTATQKPTQESIHTMPQYRTKVTLIGGGPAAISLCYQLVDAFKGNAYPLDIHVLEKSDKIGPGTPYANPDNCYLLNLPVSSMRVSTSEEVPDFSTWIKKHSLNNIGTPFLPRNVFGAYLQDATRDVQARGAPHNITIRYFPNTEVTRVMPGEKGGYLLTTAQNQQFSSDYTVLCTGHMPTSTYPHLKGAPGYYPNPLDDRAYDNIKPHEHIAVIGSRLAAIDVAMKLISIKHQGKITFFSRTGLLPAVLSKGDIQHYTLRFLTLENFSRLTKSGIRFLALSDLLELFWKEISFAQHDELHFNNIVTSAKKISPLDWLQGQIDDAKRGPRPWQQVLFSIYAILPTVWSLLSEDDKKIFLRDYWGILLTYLAAFPMDNAEKLLDLLKSKQLAVEHSVTQVSATKAGFHIEAGGTTFAAHRVFNTTGPGYDPKSVPFYRKMITDGLAVENPLGGIVVDPQTLAVRNAEGTTHEGMYAVGEITRGSCLATTDMNQVNSQVDRVCEQIWARATTLRPPLEARPLPPLIARGPLTTYYPFFGPKRPIRASTAKHELGKVLDLFSSRTTPKTVAALTMVGVGSYCFWNLTRPISPSPRAVHTKEGGPKQR